MEVDQDHFWPQLLPILNDISNAAFVTLDVEMSGIALRQRYGANDRSFDVGKPNLQQQYEETKAAAEVYQVLQIGITCVEEDHDQSKWTYLSARDLRTDHLDVYVAKPYNFNVSPLFLHKDKLAINRDITLSSSAIQFLIDNSFSIGSVFHSGVPYLSHDEQNIAHQRYAERLIKRIPDVVIPPGDTEALNFYRKSRATITSLVNQKKKEMEYVNIGAPHGGLNGFQRRLIYQLVRNEFPGYRAFSRNKGEFMQIEKVDAVKEAQVEKSRLAAFETDVARQTGLRFIIDALTGGDLSAIDPRWFLTDDIGKPAFASLSDKYRDLENVKQALRTKQHILVGHNLFTDLIFIYKTFMGTLPDNVSEFKKRLRAAFPHVIDTKYMATQEGGSMQSTSSLKELYAQLKSQSSPFISLGDKHHGYGVKGKDHEAGYDSWMTAQVFVKLSTRLAAEQKLGSSSYDSSSEMEVDYTTAVEESYTTSEDEGALLNPPDTDLASSNSVLLFKGRNDEDDKRSVGNDAPLFLQLTRLSSGNGHVTPPKNSRFSSRNVFAHLNDEGDDDSSSTISSPGQEPGRPGGALLYSPMNKSSRRSPKSPQRQGTASLLDADMDESFRQVSSREASLRAQRPSRGYDGAISTDISDLDASRLPQEWDAAQLSHAAVLKPKQERPGLQQWIPDRNSKFWDIYSNKLRVYGTETEICDLNDD
ncbi:MAG: hypothetical protein M1818_007885 [Claussenomyces sp. TS43310]|nr:MAG: hypothetical protein M1818_007885 [Claussenomyces sp. TS43310]